MTIEVEHLSKAFGAVVAVDDISFRAEVGDVVGLLGPNGAGKTTTMRVLTGYFPPSGGVARVAGFDVVGQSYEVRRRTGYLPERVPLYLDMTVRDYVSFMYEVKGHPRRGRRENVDSALERCGLADAAERLIGNLSSGYRQRVGLAQAIVGDPRVLILDEPTIGLDPAQVIEIRGLIRSLARDKTIVLSTHILSEVSAICNKVVIVNRGRVALAGELGALTGAASGPARLRVEARQPAGGAFDPAAFEKALAAIAGVLKVRRERAAGGVEAFAIEVRRDMDVRAQVPAAAVAAGAELLELRSAMPTLEELFIEATSAPVGGGENAA